MAMTSSSCFGESHFRRTEEGTSSCRMGCKGNLAFTRDLRLALAAMMLWVWEVEEEALAELELFPSWRCHSACWGSSSLGVRGRRGWVTRELGGDSCRLGWQFIQVWGRRA